MMDHNLFLADQNGYIFDKYISADWYYSRDDEVVRYTKETENDNFDLRCAIDQLYLFFC